MHACMLFGQSLTREQHTHTHTHTIHKNTDAPLCLRVCALHAYMPIYSCNYPSVVPLKISHYRKCAHIAADASMRIYARFRSLLNCTQQQHINIKRAIVRATPRRLHTDKHAAYAQGQDKRWILPNYYWSTVHSVGTRKLQIVSYCMCEVVLCLLCSRCGVHGRFIVSRACVRAALTYE